MKEVFELWKVKSSEFTRLQWIYGVVAVMLLLLGGLISLIDSYTGATIAAFSMYVAIVFIVNFVVNSVITTLIGPAKNRPSSPRR